MTSIERARAEWEVNSKPSPREGRRRNRLVIDEFRRYGEALALLEWTKVCIISKIETLRPRAGAASRLIEYLKSLADSHHISLFGNITAYVPETPHVLDGLLSQAELEAWYKKRGFFVHRGRSGIVEFWYPKAP